MSELKEREVLKPICEKEGCNTDCKECSEYLKECAKKANEVDKLLEEANKKAETNLLDLLKFKTKTDKEVFDRLPLSDYEKEKMMIDILKEGATGNPLGLTQESKDKL